MFIHVASDEIEDDEDIEEIEEISNELKELKLMMTSRGPPYMIRNNVVGAMFGYCLAAADLNSDGRADLLVGAPLQSEDINEVEFGAIHIYWDLVSFLFSFSII